MKLGRQNGPGIGHDKFTGTILARPKAARSDRRRELDEGEALEATQPLIVPASAALPSHPQSAAAR